ncbi:hypothetical protein [Companilactobacillus halodurans]|uniref:hypothetical protein n=1 Tax=Companilactobacillus halodurans TaxID=2584183 RepID=UPI00192D2E13|nr:hypothetical protein [Companilactobacillus halodurans]
METVLPNGAQDIKPEDTNKLRYSVRQNDGSGFVFINNYQDHVENEDKKNESIDLELDNENLRIPYNGGFDLDKEESCILPFNLNIKNILLKTATVQLITKVGGNKEAYFFYQPRGMKPEYVFDEDTIKDIQISKGTINKVNGSVIVHPESSEITKVTLTDLNDEQIDLYTLTNEQSLNFWKFNYGERDNVILSSAQLLVDNNGLRFESSDNEIKIKVING